MDGVTWQEVTHSPLVDASGGTKEIIVRQVDANNERWLSKICIIYSSLFFTNLQLHVARTWRVGLAAPHYSLWDSFLAVRFHYCDIIMGSIASQITSLTIVYSIVYSDADQRKHQRSASLAFVRGIHRWPVNSPHKWPVTRKMFPFDDVIMFLLVNVIFHCSG